VTIPIYRWNGQYFGFISNGSFFDARGTYLGWVDPDNRVWRADGTFLGEKVDDNYMLKCTSMAEPVSTVARVSPVAPVPPVPSVDRIAQVPRAGWKDALEEYKR
jgi:hypothetical protein